MIDYIRGIVKYKDDGALVLESGNMGFRILSTAFSLADIELGDECTIFTELVVREDAMFLVGFSNRKELEVYRMLVTVKGVGPKVALTMLSSISYTQLCLAILQKDKKVIQSAKGIGKKTAELVILELSDKKVIAAVAGASYEPRVQEAFAGESDEVLNALLGLGYKMSEAHQMLQGIDRTDKTAEEILGAALQSAFS